MRLGLAARGGCRGREQLHAPPKAAMSEKASPTCSVGGRRVAYGTAGSTIGTSGGREGRGTSGRPAPSDGEGTKGWRMVHAWGGRYEFSSSDGGMSSGDGRGGGGSACVGGAERGKGSGGEGLWAQPSRRWQRDGVYRRGWRLRSERCIPRGRRARPPPPTFAGRRAACACAASSRGGKGSSRGEWLRTAASLRENGAAEVRRRGWRALAPSEGVAWKGRRGGCTWL